MWLDDLTTRIAVEFLNDMMTPEEGFDLRTWEWDELLEEQYVDICFNIDPDDVDSDNPIPVGVYVDLVDNSGTSVGMASSEGFNPEAIAKAIKTARQDFLNRKEM